MEEQKEVAQELPSELSREDCLQLELMIERCSKAELALVNAKNNRDAIARVMSEKYKLSPEKDEINLETGKIIRR